MLATLAGRLQSLQVGDVLKLALLERGRGGGGGGGGEREFSLNPQSTMTV